MMVDNFQATENNNQDDRQDAGFGLIPPEVEQQFCSEKLPRRLQPNVVSYTAAISACVSDWSKSLVLLQKLLSENLGFEKNRTRWIFGGFKFFSLHMCNLQHVLSNIYLIHIYSCVLDLCYLQQS